MLDRRLGYRIPYSSMLTSYVRDRPLRLLASDMSDQGLCVAAVTGRMPAHGEAMCVEIELPELDETIWASAKVCNRRPDDLVTGLGLRLVAMAQRHARLIRDYCVESRRDHLAGLLARVRQPLA